MNKTTVFDPVENLWVSTEGHTTSWFKNEELTIPHRIVGPAMIDTSDPTDVHTWWCVDGVRHRLDGPAFESNDHKEWCVHGELHRIGAPAIVSPFSEEWYEFGLLHRIGAPAYTSHQYGTKKWYVRDVLHRTDGPAVESKISSHWVQRGQMYREGGLPTIEDHINGSVAWMIGSHELRQYHREDGPAIIRPNGVEYWINDRHLTHEQWLDFTKS